MQSLREIRAQDLPNLELPPKRRRQRKTASFKSVRTILSKVAKKCVKQKQKTSAQESEDIILPQNIRRSDQGRRVIRSVLTRLIDLDRLNFPANPAFKEGNDLCDVKGISGLEYHLKEFLSHAPLAFQYRFFHARSGDAYGTKVCQELTAMMQELQADKPARRKFLSFISDVHNAKLQGKIPQ